MMLRSSLMVLVLMTSPLLAQPASSLPTVDQLWQQLDSNPQEVLRGVARLLALKGPAAQQYDRSELFTIRGEASLRTRAMPAAAEAFAMAAKETADPAKKASARASEILIRRSKPTGYTPKPPRPTLAGAPPATRPALGLIPIIKQADRKMAMEALFADEMAAATPKLRAADNATALPPVIEAVKVVMDLNAVEQAATGAGTQTKQLSENLGKRAHFMIDRALGDMQASTEQTWTSASSKQTYQDQQGNNYGTAPGMVGLTSIEANQLKSVMATCEKIVPVATELAEVTESADLAKDAAAAQALAERAREVLEYDYPNSGRYNKPPRRLPQQPLPQQPQQPRQPSQPPPGTPGTPPRTN